MHRLNFATEQLLSKFGPEVVFKHTELERLGNMAIDIYTMFAVLGKFESDDFTCNLVLGFTLTSRLSLCILWGTHEIWHILC